jgi:hypothetical protein
MYVAHSDGNFGLGPGGNDGPARHATRLALNVSIFIVAILVWALMSRVDLAGGSNSAAAEECVYFGRAGARCTEHVDSKAGGKSAGDQYCHSFGRAGRKCEPEPSPR